MAKIFNKIIFSVICFTFFIFLAFQSSVLHGYCLDVPTLETALWGSMNIASEYLCGRSGRKIVNANEVQANIDGINMGTVSGDYTTVQGNASGTSVPFNLDYINSYTTDIEFSSLSAADQQKFAAALADDPSANNGSWIFKKCTYGYVTLYWLVDQAGNWLGKSLNNVMASFAPDTSALTSSIDSSITTEFPQHNFLYSDSLVSYIQFSYNNGNAGTKLWEIYNCPKDFYIWASGGYYYVLFDASIEVVASSSNAIGMTCNYHYLEKNLTQDRVVGDYSYNYVSVFNSSHVTVNGKRYAYGRLNFETNDTFSSYQDVYDALSVSTDVPPYNAELVDTDSQPYVVPDLGVNIGGIISDIYNVIDSLRDGLIGSLNGDATLTLDDSIADAISDAISDALSKGLAITDEMSGGNGGGNGSGSDPNWSVPTWLIPPWIPDLLPEEMFQMFRPIFMIVGESNSMYPLWILIPSIIIVILFFYVVISVL